MKSITSLAVSLISGMGASLGRTMMLDAVAPTAAPVLIQMPQKSRRRRRPGIGIKGMASSNLTQFGANLKAHFDRKNNTHARQQRHEQHLFHVAARQEIRRRTAAALKAA